MWVKLKTVVGLCLQIDGFCLSQMLQSCFGSWVMATRKSTKISKKKIETTRRRGWSTKLSGDLHKHWTCAFCMLLLFFLLLFFLVYLFYLFCFLHAFIFWCIGQSDNELDWISTFSTVLCWMTSVSGNLGSLQLIFRQQGLISDIFSGIHDMLIY